MKQFAKNAKAMRVLIVINQLKAALARRNIEINIEENNTLILYERQFRSFAIHLATHFRKDGLNIELLLKDHNYTMNQYKEYGKSRGIGGILYLKEENLIKVIDIQKDTVVDKKIEELVLFEP